jgi:hypothetical protein
MAAMSACKHMICNKSCQTSTMVLISSTIQTYLYSHSSVHTWSQKQCKVGHEERKLAGCLYELDGYESLADAVGACCCPPLAGRGIGLVATSDIPAGELLMVVPPLQVVLSGREGEEPGPDALAQALVQQMAALDQAGSTPQAPLPTPVSQQQQQAEWLQVLSLSTQPGGDEDKREGGAQLLPTPERLRRIRQLLKKNSSGHMPATGAEVTQQPHSTVQDAGSRGTCVSSLPAHPPHLALARSLVNANSASAHSQDPAAARLR